MASPLQHQNKQVIGYPVPISTGTPATYVTGVPLLPSPPPRPPTFLVIARSSILRSLIIAALLVLLIISCVSLIICISLRPRLPEFRLTSASVSPITSASSSEISASCNISILLKNPNHRLSISYDRLEVAIIYRDEYLLSETQLPPFYQGKDQQSLVDARLAVFGANVGNDVVKGILEGQRRGVVSFRVRVLALVRYRAGEWYMRTHLTKAYCNRVDVRFSGSTGMGSLLRPGSDCEVSL